MAAASWNDDEDLALQGLRPATQIIYLRGLRKYMDFKTGIVGVSRKVCYPGLIEVCEFKPDRGSRLQRQRLTKDGARAAIKELERAGLVVNLSQKGVMMLVLKLPLATSDYSVSVRNPTGTPQEPHSKEPREDNVESLSVSRGEVGSGHSSTPLEPHRNPIGMNPIHPLSVNNCTVLAHSGSEIFKTPGQWVEFFVNELKFQIRTAQTAKTMPMFRSWCDQGVSVNQVRDAVESGDATLGRRPDTPMYYRNFVHTVLIETERNISDGKKISASRKPMRESGSSVLARNAKKTIMEDG